MCIGLQAGRGEACGGSAHRQPSRKRPPRLQPRVVQAVAIRGVGCNSPTGSRRERGLPGGRRSGRSAPARHRVTASIAHGCSLYRVCLQAMTQRASAPSTAVCTGPRAWRSTCAVVCACACVHASVHAHARGVHAVCTQWRVARPRPPAARSRTTASRSPSRTSAASRRAVCRSLRSGRSPSPFRRGVWTRTWARYRPRAARSTAAPRAPRSIRSASAAPRKSHRREGGLHLPVGRAPRSRGRWRRSSHRQR